MIGVFPVKFEIPAVQEFVTVAIQVRDADVSYPDPELDDIYDISSDSGSDFNGLSIVVLFDPAGGHITITEDGSLDGGLLGPQGAIVVRIEAVSED